MVNLQMNMVYTNNKEPQELEILTNMPKGFLTLEEGQQHKLKS